MIKLNENQLEYLEKANKQYNVKSFGFMSGAHFLDMNYILPRRIRELKDSEGVVLMLFPSKQIAKQRLAQGGIKTKNKPFFVHQGQICYVAISSNTKKVQSLLSMKIKYVYGDHMETWNKTVYDDVMLKIKENNIVMDGTIGGLGVNPWLIEFLETEENLHYQENFETSSNPLIPEEDRKYLIKNFAEGVTDGFKLHPEGILELEDESESLK